MSVKSGVSNNKLGNVLLLLTHSTMNVVDKMFGSEYSHLSSYLSQPFAASYFSAKQLKPFLVVEMNLCDVNKQISYVCTQTLCHMAEKKKMETIR